MWSALVAERLGIIGHRETVDRLGKTLTTLERMERHGPSRPVLQLVRPSARARSSRPGRRPASRVTPMALLGRQRAGSRSACASWRAASPSCARRRSSCTTRWTSASTTAPTATRSSSTTCPRPATAPCCYDTIVSESRIASYVGIEKGELPQRQYYGAFRAFPDRLRTSRRGPIGFTRSYLGQTRLRGSASLQRHARDAVVGREHVRGADARRCSCPRSAGARAAGAPTTRSPCARRSTTG